MIRPQSKNRQANLSRTINFAAFFVFTLFSQLCLGQGLVLTLQRYGKEPVDFENIRAKDKAVTIDEVLSIDEGDISWLRKASFSVKSNSNKTIIGIAIDIIFEPRTKAPRYIHTLVRGGIDPVEKITTAPNDDFITIKFGDTVYYEVSDDRYEGILKSIKAAYGEGFKLKKVALGIQFVVYNDNTMWSYGFDFKRDPANKNGWISVDNDKDLKKISLNLLDGKNETPRRTPRTPRPFEIKPAKCSSIEALAKSPKTESVPKLPVKFVGCYRPTYATTYSCGSNGLVNCFITSMQFAGDYSHGTFISHDYRNCYAYNSSTPCWMAHYTDMPSGTQCVQVKNVPNKPKNKTLIAYQANNRDSKSIELLRRKKPVVPTSK